MSVVWHLPHLTYLTEEIAFATEERVTMAATAYAQPVFVLLE
jgi:hypothetical protein